MSTILDALRKIQRERTPRDLNEQVLDQAGPAPVRGRRWSFALPLLLLVGGVSGIAWLLWPGAETESAALARQATATAATASRPAQAQANLQARRDAARKAAEARRARTSQLARRPNLSTAPSSTPEASPRVPSAANDAGRRTPPATRIPAGPTPAERSIASRQEAVARAGAAGQPASSAPSVPSVASAPEKVFDTRLVMEPGPARTEREHTAMWLAASTAQEFPALTVESVRWHPEPGRRQAVLQLDQTRPVDAREGDIVAGVAVHRIDPGAVELRMGDTRRRIKIGR